MHHVVKRRKGAPNERGSKVSCLFMLNGIYFEKVGSMIDTGLMARLRSYRENYFGGGSSKRGRMKGTGNA